MASKLGKRVEALEVRTPQNEFSHLSDEELENQLVASLKKCEEQDPDWIVKLINDPSESAKDMLRQMAMLGYLTHEQRLLIRRHYDRKSGPQWVK